MLRSHDADREFACVAPPFVARSPYPLFKMLAMHSASLSYAGAVAPVAMRVSAPVMETKADLEAMALKLNPVVKFW